MKKSTKFEGRYGSTAGTPFRPSIERISLMHKILETQFFFSNLLGKYAGLDHHSVVRSLWLARAHRAPERASRPRPHGHDFAASGQVRSHQCAAACSGLNRVQGIVCEWCIVARSTRADAWDR